MRRRNRSRAERIETLLWRINRHIVRLLDAGGSDAAVGRWMRWRKLWRDAYNRTPGHGRLYPEDFGI